MSSFKVLFITQEDPFYVRVFFEEFLRTFPREQIAAVAIAPAMGKKSTLTLARQMLDFYGPVDFLRVGMRFAWYKVAAKLGLGGTPGKFLSIAQVCRHYGVAVLNPKDLNAPAFLDTVRAMHIDLIASVAAPQIFKERLIALPPKGCINIHNSKLPKYRGMLPNFWQMYHGERTVGTTVHRINGSLDDGTILLQNETPVNAGETLDELIVKTKRHGAKLMAQVIEQIRSGRETEVVNDKTQATYFTFPTRADAQEFRRRGYRLI